ncbi:hypothetical protein B6U70_02570 [Euryarchaeota archaeon ex4484_162]|nr:MAG: hypothetical protein B6U70_02570 [Euryarchaeota archaeon ex4484_162]RLF29262.1 MAG: hypothetical protein DRN05_02110 [Thermoplasmata archaeon]RLF36363.1 MAG: hypothetical protein DRN08_01465 [Thermoplasmata archaeon]
MITYGRGKHKVWLEQKKLGEHILYILGGGEKPHIGGIVICEPNKPSRIIRLKGHYDDIVLKPLAEKACNKYRTKVVAIGGVHVDNATKRDIEMLTKNCYNLTERI